MELLQQDENLWCKSKPINTCPVRRSKRKSSRQPLIDVPLENNQSDGRIGLKLEDDLKAGITDLAQSGEHTVQSTQTVLESKNQSSEHTVQSTQTVLESKNEVVSTASPCEDAQQYYEFLRSIMPAELYSLVETDVLCHLQPDITVDGIELLVTRYLQTGESDSTIVKPDANVEPRIHPKRRRRKTTADVEVSEAGRLQLMNATPSPPITVRRRSARLRKSVYMCKDQRNATKKVDGDTVKSAMALAIDMDCNLINPTNIDATNIDATNIDATNIDATNIDATNIDATNIDATNIDTTNIDATNIDNDISEQSIGNLNEAILDDFVEDMDTLPCLSESEEQQQTSYDVISVDVDSPSSTSAPTSEGDDSFYVSAEVEQLYRNANYKTPAAQPLATIYEEPGKNRWNGNGNLYSKILKYRYFDFTEDCWYRVPIAKLNRRRRKARKNGWKGASEKTSEQYAKLTEEALSKLDSMLLEDVH